MFNSPCRHGIRTLQVWGEGGVCYRYKQGNQNPGRSVRGRVLDSPCRHGTHTLQVWGNEGFVAGKGAAIAQLVVCWACCPV